MGGRTSGLRESGGIRETRPIFRLGEGTAKRVAVRAKFIVRDTRKKSSVLNIQAMQDITEPSREALLGPEGLLSHDLWVKSAEAKAMTAGGLKGFPGANIAVGST